MSGRQAPGPPFPEPLVRFAELFNQGAFWESHEVLEAPWRENGSLFYKALILYASVFVHAQRGNPRGVRKQMAKAFRYLPSYLPAYLGVDVAEIMAHGERVLAILDARGEPEGAELAGGVPYPHLRLQPALVRGDEPELRPQAEGDARE